MNACAYPSARPSSAGSPRASDSLAVVFDVCGSCSLLRYCYWRAVRLHTRLVLLPHQSCSLVKHDLVAFEVTILMIDWLALIVGGALLAIVFRRAGRPASLR